MYFPTLLLIAIGLAMDCLAVSLAAGTRPSIPKMKTAGILAVSFGGFQLFMNIAGWAVGAWLLPILSGFDHWVAFLLLAGIGGKMISEAVTGKGSQKWSSIRPVTLLLLAIATSIDSLGVGFSFALIESTILIPALVIGGVSALFSFGGVILGNRLTEHFGSRMEILGGIILIGIGIHFLVEQF